MLIAIGITDDNKRRKSDRSHQNKQKIKQRFISDETVKIKPSG